MFNRTFLKPWRTILMTIFGELLRTARLTVFMLQLKSFADHELNGPPLRSQLHTN